MGEIERTRTVGELVVERPGRSRVFERFGVDYCCGGKRTLEAACARAAVDPDALQEALRDDDAASTGRDERDWSRASSTELVDHIVAGHHAWLREALPRLTDLLARVVKAHAAKDPRLAEAQRTFAALRAELESHMAKEENILFPAIVALDRGRPSLPSFDGPIAVMEHEHDDAGRALERLRALTDGYEPPADACNTHRALLDALAELERDLHLHIHKENNILFPRYASRPAAAR